MTSFLLHAQMAGCTRPLSVYELRLLASTCRLSTAACYQRLFGWNILQTLTLAGEEEPSGQLPFILEVLCRRTH